MTRDHPYFPPGVDIPGYAPNATPLPALLARFSVIHVLVLVVPLVLARWITAGRRGGGMGMGDQLLFCWFVLCGSIHCLFEGYFVLNHARLAAGQSLPDQLWKEYALSDSRYLTSDPFTLCIEAITSVVWGPLCYAAAVAIVCGKKAEGLRYFLQVVTSVAHIYGVAMYFGTFFAEGGISSCRPEAMYFWMYLVGFNSPWAVVPAYILFSSARKIQAAFAAADAAVMGSAEGKKTR